MAIGPMQLIAIGFDPTDHCKKRMRRVLEEQHGIGAMRVIDLLVVEKDSQGTLTRLEGFQLPNDELGLAGQALGILIGLDTRKPAVSPGIDVGALAFAEHNFGLSRKDIMGMASYLAPGTAAVLVLIEHQWALRLKAAVCAAGGWMLAQSLVTPEALLWVGDEVQATAEAETVIELTSAVDGAALLETLADMAESALSVEGAGSAETTGVSAVITRTAAAVQAVRALIVGGLIAEVTAKQAIGILVGAGLIAEATVIEAEQRAEQTAIETQAAIIAVEEVAQGPLP